MLRREPTDRDALVEVFHELYAGEFGRLTRFAGLLGADDAEGTANDAFVRLYDRLDKIREVQSMPAYLRVTVLNLVRKEATRNSRFRRFVKDHSVERPATNGAPETFDDSLARAIRELPQTQREALVMRYWLDLSIAETANMMGVPLGTAKSHVSRGLTALRRTLDCDSECETK